MKGNTLTEFIDDLLLMGGPEKEFKYNGKTYFLQSQAYELDKSLMELIVFECFGEEKYVFRCVGKTCEECVRQFEKANMFDGRNIYEAESEIEVLYG